MLKVRTVALVAIALVGGTSLASADAPMHCVVYLVPTPATDDRPGASDPVDGGCYTSYAEAIEVGTSGDVVLPSSIQPGSLTQRILIAATRRGGGSVLIGTEWTDTGHGGQSQNYFAPATCSPGNIVEVSNLGVFNDDFASGQGFGGCDENKKFKSASFGGDVRTCTPDCWGYGDLNNEVSSLRWRP